MYEQYWGLSSSPFDPRHLPEEAMRSTSYEEAIARMLYLVENHRPGGMLLGGAGCGKTTVLKYFERTVSKVNRRIAQVNLSNIDGPELLSLLADGFCTPVPDEASSPMLRRVLRDFLAGRTCQGSSIVVICDDVDQASEDVIGHLLWFARTADMTGVDMTWLLAADKARVGLLPTAIFNLCELRVDLEPWSPQQASEYLDCAMRAAGAEESVFTPAAINRMNELAEGLPGPLARLAELSLLAAAGDDRKNIDTETVETVYDELYPMSILTS